MKELFYIGIFLIIIALNIFHIKVQMRVQDTFDCIRMQQMQIILLLSKDYPDEEIIHKWKLKTPKMEK